MIDRAVYGGEDYLESAFRGSTSGRVDRLAKVAVVISVTILTLTLMSARQRREHPRQRGLRLKTLIGRCFGRRTPVAITAATPFRVGTL